MTTLHHLATSVHGRYLVRGPGGSAPLLVGFHGYAEDAARHLQALDRIPGVERWRRVAVDALHPFYERKTGEVVGSWMTRRDRELAIADNLRYVGRVVEAARGDGDGSSGERPLVFAGFSQGVAMAFRAAAGAGHPCHGLIVNGGDVPPELAAAEGLALPPVLLGRGRRDEWYPAAQAERDVALLRSRAIPVRCVVFDGGHEWAAEFAQAAGQFLAAVLEAPGATSRGSGAKAG